MANIASQATITYNNMALDTGRAITELHDGVLNYDAFKFVVSASDTNMELIFTFPTPVTIESITAYLGYGTGQAAYYNGLKAYVGDTLIGSYPDTTTAPQTLTFEPVTGTVFKLKAVDYAGKYFREVEINSAAGESVTVTIDTLRSIVSAVSVPADTSRMLSGPVSIGCDTSRMLTDAVSVSVDTLRSIVRIESVSADTLRSLIQTVSAPIDTRRRIVGPLSSIKQLTIDLRAQVLGDSFSLDAYNAPALKTPYGSTLYGWPWEFVVRSKQYDPATKKYSWAGDYDIADLLKKYVVFTRVLFDSDDIMSAIASRLGKSLVIAADTHSINPLAPTTKIMDAISSLYGWTSSIPHQLVNVFLRGDVLYVLQRGKESSSYTPVKYNIVSLEESQMDTLMDQKTGDPKITGEALTINSSGEEIYVNGTWSGGGSSVTFENGLNVRTVTISDTQTTETNSSYDSAKYITHKLIDVTDSANSAADTTTNTSYSYDPWEGQPYLSGEYTTVYKGSRLQSTTKTSYSPLGFNFFGCTQSTYNSAGKRTGFSSYVSEGRPGGPASPYTRGRAAAGNTVPVSVDVARNPLSPASIPATDLSTVTRYKNGLEWLDGRTQYVITIECWDDHVMDYAETIIINGLTWYLNSNQIVITGDQPKAKQTASLVRWA